VRPGQSGFTLIEAMVVVAIVGILATLAVYGVRKYILAAKSSEAIEMIRAIKSAQEAYKAETFQYLPVNGKTFSGTTGFFPTDDPDDRKRVWGGTSATAQSWARLGVQADAPVQFTYGCAAGTGSDVPAGHGSSSAVSGWPSSALGMPWYVVQAVGDLDADETNSVFTSASFTSEIFIDKEGE
jgi:prepilin-type N-terminal cleavage/methylation domain-containing protein